MTIATTCARCGAPFEADRADILAGPSWRLCPSCRRAESVTTHDATKERFECPF